jgi:hypothetical protein
LQPEVAADRGEPQPPAGRLGVILHLPVII